MKRKVIVKVGEARRIGDKIWKVQKVSKVAVKHGKFFGIKKVQDLCWDLGGA